MSNFLSKFLVIFLICMMGCSSNNPRHFINKEDLLRKYEALYPEAVVCECTPRVFYAVWKSNVVGQVFAFNQAEKIIIKTGDGDAKSDLKTLKNFLTKDYYSSGNDFTIVRNEDGLVADIRDDRFYFILIIDNISVNHGETFIVVKIDKNAKEIGRFDRLGPVLAR